MHVLLLLALTGGAPSPAVYFHSERTTLRRVEVELPAGPGGRVGVRQAATVRLPGRVRDFTPGDGDRSGQALAVVCPQGPTPTDAAPACPLFHVDAEGRALPLGVSGLWGALLPSSRFLWLGEDLTLRSRALSGGEAQVVARGVVEPRLDPAGARAGVALVPGLERLLPGAQACPGVVELGPRPAVRQLPGPCDAQGPFLSADGTALYVSTASGQASFLAQRGPGQARPVAGTPQVPVAGKELVWLGPRLAVYTARYGQDELWTVEVDSGAAIRVGPGREPAWVTDGLGRRAVIAVDGEGPATRLVVVPAGGAR